MLKWEITSSEPCAGYVILILISGYKNLLTDVKPIINLSIFMQQSRESYLPKNVHC